MSGPIYGATLTPEQRRVTRAICRRLDDEQVQTVGGYAGTGKSTVLASLADDLQGFSVVSFTGKAANVLRRRGGHRQVVPRARWVYVGWAVVIEGEET